MAKAISSELSKDQKFYDLRWAGADEVSPRERNRVAFTLSRVPQDCRSVLDVGAGNGVLSNELAAHGWDVTAADISEVALSRVKGPTLLRSADNLVGVANRSFDLVICTEMLEHLDDSTYRGSLREFARVARSAILITVPNHENMKENTAVCAECGCRYHIWSHRRCFTPEDLRSLFTGFELISATAFGDHLRRYNPLLLWVKTRVANGWAMDDVSPCPECHSFRTALPERPRLAGYCDLINSNLPQVRYKPWLLGLYRRRVL